MKPSAHKSAAAAGAFVLLAALPQSAEDLKVVLKASGSGRTTTYTYHISGNKVRVSEQGVDTIYDIPAGSIIKINKSTKSYFETSLVEIRTGFTAIEGKASPSPRGAQSTGTPEQRPPAPITIEKGSATKRVAGYLCQDYTLRMGDTTKWEVCSAKGGLQMRPEFVEAQMMGAARMGPTGERLLAMLEELKKLPGFPMAEVRTDVQGSMRSRYATEVVSVARRPLPASTFAVPAGYEKKESPYKTMLKPPSSPSPRP